MPFTCEVCGRRRWPDLIPAVGAVLQCTHCGDERTFLRPPLLVVTGTAGAGKSTLCARLAGTIPGTVLLDADIFAEELTSVVPPNQDYQAFWRTMMRLAHELAQNDVVVVYFSTMLPGQLLANADSLDYFESVHFLCLTCRPDVLRTRLTKREGGGVSARVKVSSRIRFWLDFNDSLVATASKIPTATVVDASRTSDEVAHDIRDWITARVSGSSGRGTHSIS